MQKLACILHTGELNWYNDFNLEHEVMAMQLGLTIPLMKHLKINKLPYGEDCTAVSAGIYIVSGYITIAACWRYTAKHDTCLCCMA